MNISDARNLLLDALNNGEKESSVPYNAEINDTGALAELFGKTKTDEISKFFKEEKISKMLENASKEYSPRELLGIALFIGYTIGKFKTAVK